MPEISPYLIDKIQKTKKKDVKIMIIDVGTTSSRANIYDHNHQVISSHRKLTEILKPAENKSEINPIKLWTDFVEICKIAINKANLLPNDLTCMGITTQREIFLKTTGVPISNIITWQDRSTIESCTMFNKMIPFRLREKICRNDGIFGTVESWLAFNLTRGVHS
ncbi:hypothetical protein MXB_4735 [Myxobolus squamalis]|nr:hypothetical protein MXB_4735 [Myxobolus squamalis]